CSLYPEHKETRPLPGDPGSPEALAEAAAAGTLPSGVGELCPKCGEADGGTLTQKRGRFGPVIGCSPYPDCDFIKKERPAPPPPAAARLRGHVPQVPRGSSRDPPGAPDGLAVLGLLALSQVRLHVLARAARGSPRRGPGTRGSER